MGAEKVNDAVLCLMREFTAKHPEVYHIHATGSIELELCTSQFREMGLDKCENIELCEYIYDMPVRMAAADLTINRAGAMTVSELAITGKCAIFIPSPNVAENHQYKNAKVLYDADAAGLFEEKELTVSQMVVSLQQAMDDLWCHAPSLRVVFTVSPYRYAKYGFHESQLSKAALLLAVDEICSRNDGRCVYFPAYEIVMDELRDYRFYADDMLHPSEMAVNYIWERFTEKCFAKETLNYMKEWERIEKSFTHRPLHPASSAYEMFMKSTRMKLRELVDRYPAILNTPAYAKLKDYKI
jgi:hypothetical protein